MLRENLLASLLFKFNLKMITYTQQLKFRTGNIVSKFIDCGFSLHEGLRMRAYTANMISRRKQIV